MSYNQDLGGLLEGYNARDLKIATVASHSALDVFDGAKDEGFKTIAVCQKGREKPYLRFRRVVDVHLILEKFADVTREDIVFS